MAEEEKAGGKVKGERGKGGKAPLLNGLKPLDMRHREEDHICAETLAARHKGSVFKPLDLSMGFPFSLSPFPFSLRPWRIA